MKTVMMVFGLLVLAAIGSQVHTYNKAHAYVVAQCMVSNDLPAHVTTARIKALHCDNFADFKLTQEAR